MVTELSSIDKEKFHNKRLLEVKKDNINIFKVRDDLLDLDERLKILEAK
jgi:hypothetical protein